MSKGPCPACNYGLTKNLEWQPEPRKSRKPVGLKKCPKCETIFNPSGETKKIKVWYRGYHIDI